MEPNSISGLLEIAKKAAQEPIIVVIALSVLSLSFWVFTEFRKLDNVAKSDRLSVSRGIPEGDNQFRSLD